MCLHQLFLDLIAIPIPNGHPTGGRNSGFLSLGKSIVSSSSKIVASSDLVL
jgi:hypothetical protein